jgi:FAD/FMN-containing dehydrogenase
MAAGERCVLSRRQWLRGAAAASACAALGAWRRDSDAAPASRAALLPCPVSRPGDRGHAPFRTSWNGCWNGNPTTVAHVRDADDVAAALRWARAEGLPVTVRSGGHSFVGASVNDGLVIDLSALRAVEPGARAGCVRAMGGVRIGELESALHHRFGTRTMTVGSCSSVGVSGLLLGGGFGAMSRVHGLTVDALEEAEAVLADGTVATANEHEESDLFWALRGGGAGFAVVTRMEFRTRPWKPVHACTQHWTWEDGAHVLETWSRWIAALPDDAAASVVWMTSGDPSNSDVRTIVRSEGGADAAARLAESLAAELARTPRRVQAWSTKAPSVRPQMPSGGPRTANASAFAAGPVAADAASRVADALRAWRDGTVRGVEGTAMLLCNAFGGAVARVPADATAFAHRNACFLAEFAAEWPEGRRDLDAANRAWVRATADEVRSGFGPGSYVNYADPGLADWRRAYWGANLPRLQAIRAKLDPTGLLAGKIAV